MATKQIKKPVRKTTSKKKVVSKSSKSFKVSKKNEFRLQNRVSLILLSIALGVALTAGLFGLMNMMIYDNKGAFTRIDKTWTWYRGVFGGTVLFDSAEWNLPVNRILILGFVLGCIGFTLGVVILIFKATGKIKPLTELGLLVSSGTLLILACVAFGFTKQLFIYELIESYKATGQATQESVEPYRTYLNSFNTTDIGPWLMTAFAALAGVTTITSGIISVRNK